jgi:heat shock protein HslJ
MPPVLRTLFILVLCASCTAGVNKSGSGSQQLGKALTGSAWWVEDIAGKGVIDMSHTTIEFIEDGRVGGDTGCNRYFGSYEIGDGKISFGPLAGTRKACAESLMDQEMKFFQAMEKVSRWEIAPTGLLHLQDAEGNSRLRAWRVEE